jgi:hypothetical protein
MLHRRQRAVHGRDAALQLRAHARDLPLQVAVEVGILLAREVADGHVPLTRRRLATLQRGLHLADPNVHQCARKRLHFGRHALDRSGIAENRRKLRSVLRERGAGREQQRSEEQNLAHGPTLPA